MLAESAIGSVLLEVIGKQQDGGFLILDLPGVEKLIGRGEGVDVVGIDRGRFGSG